MLEKSKVFTAVTNDSLVPRFSGELRHKLKDVQMQVKRKSEIPFIWLWEAGLWGLTPSGCRVQDLSFVPCSPNGDASHNAQSGPRAEPGKGFSMSLSTLTPSSQITSMKLGLRMAASKPSQTNLDVGLNWVLAMGRVIEPPLPWKPKPST